MITHSWMFFYALIFVLALLWGAIEIWRSGYRRGWNDRHYREWIE